MAQIQVESTDQGEYYTFRVTVKEGQSRTQHQVTLQKADYIRLAAQKASPAELVRESFAFLLEREPKESILRSFDLTVIGRYFPVYEREISKRL